MSSDRLHTRSGGGRYNLRRSNSTEGTGTGGGLEDDDGPTRGDNQGRTATPTVDGGSGIGESEGRVDATSPAAVPRTDSYPSTPSVNSKVTFAAGPTPKVSNTSTYGAHDDDDLSRSLSYDTIEGSDGCNASGDIHKKGGIPVADPATANRVFTLLVEQLAGRKGGQLLSTALASHRTKLIVTTKLGEFLRSFFLTTMPDDEMWFDELNGKKVLWPIQKENHHNFPSKSRVTQSTLVEFLLLLTELVTNDCSFGNYQSVDELVEYLTTSVVPDLKYTMKSGNFIVETLKDWNLVTSNMNDLSDQFKKASTLKPANLSIHRFAVLDIICHVLFPDNSNSLYLSELLGYLQKKERFLYDTSNPNTSNQDIKNLWNKIPSNVQSYLQHSYSPVAFRSYCRRVDGRVAKHQLPQLALSEQERRYFGGATPKASTPVDPSESALAFDDLVEKIRQDGQDFAALLPSLSNRLLGHLEEIERKYPGQGRVREAANALRSHTGACAPAWWPDCEATEPASALTAKECFSSRNLLMNNVVRTAVQQSVEKDCCGEAMCHALQHLDQTEDRTIAERVGAGQYLLGEEEVFLPAGTSADTSQNRELILYEFLGNGSFQLVFSALDIKRNAIVAVKISTCSHERLLKDFVRLTELTSLMSNEFVVRILGYKILSYETTSASKATIMTVEQLGEYDMDQYYENMQGDADLQFSSKMEQDAVDDTASLVLQKHKGPIMQLAKIVQHFTIKGIDNRDMKPGNIMFCVDDPDKPGRFKSADNGTVKWKTNAGGVQTIVGSSSYLPPESDSGADYNTADLFAFAVMCYELLVFGLPPDDHRYSDSCSDDWFKEAIIEKSKPKYMRDELQEWNDRKMIFKYQGAKEDAKGTIVPAGIGEKLINLLSPIILTKNQRQNIFIDEVISSLQEIFDLNDKSIELRHCR
mmetsp:Transcript_58462/g.142983  ORF Transcript_58462/g.142983 Transcript_58462/m.142983 type:complete len:926 (+) Transcript_58462:400-3177(+)